MYDQERQGQLRKRWKAYKAYCDYLERKFRKKHGRGDDEPTWMLCVDGLRLPRLPEELRDLTCGAKTRKGTPCKNKSIYKNGRCKFHGGLSTGPTSEEGKRRCAENGKIAARRKAEEADPMKGS